MDALLCICKWILNLERVREREEDERRLSREEAEGGLERRRQAESWRMELSSGYIWGLCDSWIPFAPYSSRHHVSVSAASVKIEKSSWWRELPQTASACAALPPEPFHCVCYSRSWKEKTPAGWHQYYFSTFHCVAKDPMSPGPASVQHTSYLQRFSSIDLLLWYNFCFSQNWINSFINRLVLGGALRVFQLITQIDRCSQIRWGFSGTSPTSLWRIFH